MLRPAPSPTDDRDLIRRAASGERAAQHRILDRYGPMVYGLCRATDPDPDDGYQEIWEKALRALPRFDPDGPATLSTWLYRIAHHHLVDRQRKQRVRAVIGPLDREPAAEGALDDSVSLAQRAERLRAALARLPDAQRRAVVFHYIEEIPVGEVAEREGVPVGTVKSRLHQARARLLALLGGGR
jgi:RNA polymerase sigma-70 factor (ECF subfamily)